MAFTPRRLMRGASGAGGQYQIARSLRFNSADSTYLSRTPSSAGNQKTWTWSGWVKRSALGTNQVFFSAGSNGFVVRFNETTDYLEVYNFSGGYQLQVITAQVFRDVSAWYHIVIAIDTTQATDTNRFKLYVNGSQVTSFYGAPTYPSQNTEFFVNGTVVQALGILNSIGQHFSGYMTEVNFVNAQQLTPSSFGETNTQTGVWQPKAYAGTYGTNGFYLNFSDNSNTTAATLGKDYSGNGNNFTPTNFSVTAGAGNDSMVDVPTPYGIDTGAGGTVRGNYATINPYQLIANVSVSNGNLYLQSNNNQDQIASAPSTIAVRTGKWYAEFTASAFSGTPLYLFGVARAAWSPIILDSGGYYGRFYVTSGGVPSGYAYHSNGNFYTNDASIVGTGATYVSGDIIGVALDLDAGSITLYKNGVSQGTPFTSIPLGVDYVFAGGVFTYSYPTPTNIGAFFANFGQRPFAYTAPSGFKALNTQNLPTPTIGATAATQASKFFAPTLYTGTNANLTVTNSGGFQPDFVWIKSRSQVSRNTLFDAVRGVTKVLWSDSTDAEGTANAGTGLTSLNSNGFTLGTEIAGTSGSTNVSGVTYVAWNWKAGGTAVTNTSGQISSQVSANPTAGFSIVTFTADGTTKTVGHGLGVKPSLVIAKVRSGVGSWILMTDIIDGTMQYAVFNSGGFGAIGYNAPTSSVFSYNDNNGNTQLAYCFASIEGYSKIGVYTGNGSVDGPFVHTGFRPRWVLIKRTDNAGNWLVQDTARTPFNWTCNMLALDLANAENTGEAESTYGRDYLSNGFKIRASHSSHNASAGKYLYVAFAESPFKTSLAR